MRGDAGLDRLGRDRWRRRARKANKSAAALLVHYAFFASGHIAVVLFLFFFLSHFCIEKVA